MAQVYHCWWRICWEINVFSRFEYHMFYVLYSFVTYLLTLPCNNCTYCGQSHPKGKCPAYDKRVNHFWSMCKDRAIQEPTFETEEEMKVNVVMFEVDDSDTFCRKLKSISINTGMVPIR
jgi:hypothetical protein